MARLSAHVILIVVCHVLTEHKGLTLNARMSEEDGLIQELFKDYNPTARPVIDSSNTVNVQISFSLLQIQELNVRSQILTTTGLVILNWKDERLEWTNQRSTIDSIVIDASKLWLPEFAIINGADDLSPDYSKFQAVVYKNGLVRWQPGGVFRTVCQIDITFYPFDAQNCSILFGAWTYRTTKMNLTISAQTRHVITDKYEHNGEWELTHTEVIRREFSFECCKEQKFSNVAFQLCLRRRHTFYILNVILPGLFTSAVLLSIFFCTPSQKIHIGVAALLSFRLYLVNVADTIPRTSDHVPLLGVYLTATMAITTLSMCATVLVSNLYDSRDRPVPKWAHKLFRIYVARVLCMRVYVQLPLLEMTSIDAESPDKRSEIEIKNSGSNDLNPADEDQVTSWQKMRYRNRKKREEYSRDWIQVAAVFDRLFFWICFVFTVITTLMLFHPLTIDKQLSTIET